MENVEELFVNVMFMIMMTLIWNTNIKWFNRPTQPLAFKVVSVKMQYIMAVERLLGPVNNGILVQIVGMH
jgi:hypothetical protein